MSVKMPLPLFLYVHIPYCKQKCSYCDFITFEKNKILPSRDYVSVLKKEIKSQSKFFKKNLVQTLYFGGGTPSLIPAQEIGEIISEMKKHFHFDLQPEITIEINPGTLGENKLEEYQKYGVNRFSLGVQTFTPWFLKKSGRLHTVEDSVKDLKLLQKNKLNFSLDLMFGFPHQTLASLKEDVHQALSFDPSHVSIYNLTIPKNHELSLNRPQETTQIKMFQIIEEELKKGGLNKYEISNFAKKNRTSKHNSAYWEGKLVLGLGVGAHSYLPSSFTQNNKYGLRFWNSYQLKNYISQRTKSQQKLPFENLPEKQVENLKAHEALTDFCHTRLRRKKGLLLKELQALFHSSLSNKVESRLLNLKKENWLEETSGSFSLTPQGELLSNQIFLGLTFSQKDLSFKYRL